MKMIKIGVLALVAILAFGIPSISPAAKDSLFEDKVVARGKGFEVTKSQLEEAFIAFKASRRSLPESQRSIVESNLLDRLVVSKILLKRATEEDKAKGKEKADQFMKDLRSRVPSEDIFKSQLKAMGITLEKFEARALEDAVCEEVLDREVKATVMITDEEARKFYDENPKQFEQPELAKGWHLLMTTRDSRTGEDFSAQEKTERKAAIEKLRQRAKGGEDFAKLAKEYSEHPAAKKSGGEFTIPRNSREPEMELAAFSLEPNQISEVITTPYGFHVLKLKEKSPARKLDFSEVQKDIKDEIQLQEVKKRLPDYFEKIKKEANTEVLVKFE